MPSKRFVGRDSSSSIAAVSVASWSLHSWSTPWCPPARSSTTRSAGPLVSQVAKEVAIACLLTPDQAHGVRSVARFIDRAPSAVSAAMSNLRDDGFLTSGGEAIVPDLFNELVGV